MNKQDFMNLVYDLLAQNPIAGAYGMNGRERDYLTALVDHVDTERNVIVLRNSAGLEFELQLVMIYAPSEAVAGGTI